MTVPAQASRAELASRGGLTSRGGLASRGDLASKDDLASRGAMDAEIDRYATGNKLEELHMDEDTVQEVKASWVMFCKKKGGVDEAENAVCEKLQKAAPGFASLLYPDKALPTGNNDAQAQEVDRETGQVSNGAKSKRLMAELMTAGTKAGMGGGGCPMMGGGGMGGAGGMNGGGRINMMASIADEEINKEEFRKVMQKVFAAEAEADKVKEAQDKAKGIQKNRAPSANRKGISEDAGTKSNSVRQRGKTPTKKRRPSVDKGTDPPKDKDSEVRAGNAENRRATPSGKSTEHMRMVSL